MSAPKFIEPNTKRCERCLGMGYFGRTVRGKWNNAVHCTTCRGSGQVPITMRQPKWRRKA